MIVTHLFELLGGLYAMQFHFLFMSFEIFLIACHTRKRFLVMELLSALYMGDRSILISRSVVVRVARTCGFCECI